MPAREPTATTNLDKIYGSEPIPWSRPGELLADGVLDLATFVGTVRPDGRPHSARVGMASYGGDLYFQSGPESRKLRNIAANPACTVSMSLPGIDIVVEGDAAHVTDAETLEAVAALFREHGWPVQVEGDALTAPYNAPTAGPPPWDLYRVTPQTVFGVATEEPYGATRWRF
jgi:nitroimidazol reductase NimA-like FMN-containing flavoprotein (pyridoxamine 5'-phosphate oxidase superfamily)